MSAPELTLAARIAEILALDPAADAIEFGGRWYTWGELADTAEQAARLVREPGAEVGILLRNRPASIGLLLGVVMAGGCVVTINPGRGRDRTRDDIAGLDVDVLAGFADDLATFVPEDSVARLAAVPDLGEPIVITPGTSTSTTTRPGVAVRMLTSGTTGPPKRVDLPSQMLERVLVGAKHYESASDSAPRLRTGVAIVNSPLVHLGGLFRVLQCITDGRPFCFLEKFEVGGWVDAVRRHRPATASLVPTALRMVLEAAPDPADLSSLRSVISGTAPLDPDDADAFFDRYGVPVLITYAATEFGGSVAGWNVADHREFWSAKRGSIGRAHKGCALRVVDQETGEPVANGEEGLLEVQARQLGSDEWVHTTDLARMDDDGFVWILGRADQAIIRGGFKVRPEDIKATLERHPSVRGASVVSRTDRRLGEVPVALVELRADAPAVDEAGLLAHAEAHLARYELPAEIRIVDLLPRTDSGKVDLGAVRAVFADDSIESEA